MLSLIESNAKNGAIIEDFDDNYKTISQQINELKIKKLDHIEKQQAVKSYSDSITQLDNAIGTISTQLREFDQDLVKRLIQSIKVNRKMRLEIQFHSGIVIEQIVEHD